MGVEQGRGEGFVDVDLTTHACGGSPPVVESQPGAGVDPVPWVSQSGVVTGSQPIVAADRLEGSLGNLRSATVDAERACLAGRAVAYRRTTDGPVEQLLSDGRVLSLPGPVIHEGTVAAPGPGSSRPEVLGQSRSAGGGV